MLNTVTSPWLGVNYVAFWDSIQGSTASRNAMMNAGVDIIRFPGGAPGDWYDWANPCAGGWSSTSTMKLWNYAQGIGSQCVLLLQTNPTTNTLGNGLPNDSSGTHAADWVTYCKNNNIAVPYWEIGNEEDITLTSNYQWAAYQWYLDKFGEQAAAMKARDSSIKILGNVGTNAWYWWGIHSLDMFMQTHGNKIGTGLVDAVSVHSYDCAGNTWNHVIANVQVWQSRMTYIKSVILARDTRDLPVYITEGSGALGPGTGNMASLMARALGDADWIGALRNSGVKGVTLFGCIHTVVNNWGLLYGSGETGPSGGADSPTPGYYVLPIWTKVGNTVVQVTGLTDPSYTLSAYASTKAGSAQVVLINKTSAARSVQVAFNGFDPDGKSVAIYELRPQNGGTSDTLAYYNGVLMPNPSTTSPLPDPALDTCSGSTYTRTVPAYSITLLDFGGSGNILPNVSITSPLSGDIFASGDDIVIEANASDTNGFVTKVGFYQGATKLGEDTSAPYSYTWNNVPVGRYSLTARATDNNDGVRTSPAVGIGVTSGEATGYILREWWTGIGSGTAVTNLTSDINYPTNPNGRALITSLEGPTNWANYYGTRIRGFLYPPADGNYTFWIASDANSQLWLSTDADPCHAAQIAYISSGWTNSRQWTKYPSQTSTPKPLLAGHKYYIEALQKEGLGDDNIAVAWLGPGITQQVIDGVYLSPYLYNFKDYAIFAPQWLKTDCSRSNAWCSGADRDRDGNVGLDDLAAFADGWLAEN